MRRLMLCFVLCSILFLSGCGTLFYSERRGNNSNLDTTVAVLDGIGLIFFILPGVIAYAVDFTTGCIYLSPAKSSGHLAQDEVIQLDKTRDFNEQVDQILSAHYGMMAGNALQVNGIYGINNWYQMQNLNVNGFSDKNI